MLSLGSCKLPGWAWVNNPGQPDACFGMHTWQIADSNTNRTCGDAEIQAEPIGEDSTQFG